MTKLYRDRATGVLFPAEQRADGQWSIIRPDGHVVIGSDFAFQYLMEEVEEANPTS